MQSTAVPALVIRRTYAAPPALVYKAFTDPELARQFLCPAGLTNGEVSLDVRVGGKYRVEMLMPEGEPYVAYGEYREVVPDSRLSMTWIWQEDNPAEEHETLLTIEFNAHGSGTELILTHERLASMESRTNHGHGWTSMMEKLDCLDVPQGSIVAHAQVAAPPERVFQALTSDEVTQWWVRPGVFDTREFKADVRKGGRFTASGIGRGQPYAIEGEFTEIDAPRKLAHTWQLAGSPNKPTTVTYVLEPREGGTHITLRQDGFASPDAANNTRVGWETSFEALEEMPL
ncbi:MAG TPA: SRPBCC family protein [Candidatus Baltobacteraceae bacterium]|nr:SRPBCC family protein [Candidatus Baltobacteraceae bacterium]